MNGVVSALGVGVADGSDGWPHAQMQDPPRKTTRTNDFPPNIYDLAATISDRAARTRLALIAPAQFAGQHFHLPLTVAKPPA
jgi:hypothetical protein